MLVPEMSHLCNTCREAWNRASFPSAPWSSCRDGCCPAPSLQGPSPPVTLPALEDGREDCILFIIFYIHLQDTSDRPTFFVLSPSVPSLSAERRGVGWCWKDPWTRLCIQCSDTLNGNATQCRRSALACVEQRTM